MTRICAGTEPTLEANKKLKEAVEAELSTPDNSINIPDGSIICLEGSDYISTYFDSPDLGNDRMHIYEDVYSPHFSKHDYGITKINTEDQEGKIHFTTYIHKSQNKVKATKIKNAGKLIKEHVEEERAMKAFIQSIIDFLKGK